MRSKLKKKSAKALKQKSTGYKTKSTFNNNKAVKKSIKKVPDNKKVIFKKPVMGLNNYLAKSPAKKTKKTKKVRSFRQHSNFKFKNSYKTLVPALTVLITFGSLTYYFVFRDLPSPYDLTSRKPPMASIIRDRKGIVLYRVYSQANRTQLSWNQIPDIVKNSTIAIEDANFYNHIGIDFKAIVRAFVNNLKQEDVDYLQGASTIPQQLIKNRLLSNERTYERKVREIVLSLWSELIYSKQELLTMYLNTVGYGGPAYGIEAASQMYFNKSAADLTLAQAAFLAGLPAAPTTFSPYGTNPQLADLRKLQVLERMLNLGMLKEKEYIKALNEKITLSPQRINILAPHFVMYVKDELVKKFGEKEVEEGGFDVTTTLDLNIHNKVQTIASGQIEEIKNRFRINNAAVLVTNPGNGEILSMVGSVDYFDTDNDGHYNAVLAPRQPGSSFKPVTYAYAFDHGFSPTSSILDAPVVYRTPGSKEVYAPVNYDGKYHGTVTVRSALANSYNIPAVKTLEKLGVENVRNLGIKMGLKHLTQAGAIGLSLTLGGAEVTMMDMARAYGTIENLGVKKELKSILAIKDVNFSEINR